MSTSGLLCKDAALVADVCLSHFLAKLDVDEKTLSVFVTGATFSWFGCDCR